MSDRNECETVSDTPPAHPVLVVRSCFIVYINSLKIWLRLIFLLIILFLQYSIIIMSEFVFKSSKTQYTLGNKD